MFVHLSLPSLSLSLSLTHTHTHTLTHSLSLSVSCLSVLLSELCACFPSIYPLSKSMHLLRFFHILPLYIYLSLSLYLLLTIYMSINLSSCLYLSTILYHVLFSVSTFLPIHILKKKLVHLFCLLPPYSIFTCTLKRNYLCLTCKCAFPDRN